MSPGKAISPPLRQTLATTAYVVLVACFLCGSVWLIADLMGKSDQLAEASSRLDQLSRRSPRPLSPTSNDAAALSLFLAGRTQTIAAAALEQRIKDAVEKSGGALTSSQVEADNPSAKDGFVRLTASVEVDQPGIQSTLYDIEAGTPYLFVDKLSIQSPEDLGDAQSGRFRMTIAVVGQWRRSE